MVQTGFFAGEHRAAAQIRALRKLQHICSSMVDQALINRHLRLALHTVPTKVRLSLASGRAVNVLKLPLWLVNPEERGPGHHVGCSSGPRQVPERQTSWPRPRYGFITAGSGLSSTKPDLIVIKLTAGHVLERRRQCLSTVAPLAKYSKVYCSAPTHVAVDNFCARMERICRQVTDRHNAAAKAEAQLPRKLIIRAYKMPDELSPAVMSVKDQDAEGNFMNRHGHDGKISPLEFLKTSGWPVYRLRVQLRMAKDLFGMCHREVYPDVPFEYGPNGDIDLPQHSPGRVLETMMCAKFPDLAPAPPGTLQPCFVHCKGSICHIDPDTKSKKSPDQVKVALDLLVDLVDATAMVVITPYKANKEASGVFASAPSTHRSPAPPPLQPSTHFRARRPTLSASSLERPRPWGPALPMTYSGSTSYYPASDAGCC
ncbi:hypothetical protein G6O67_000822 [Ophiocordyceps sinensis]|uniref:Uncharacterized protein n=2 Tax=Ophiocordyceps sinensis TaxID=72228 RepID=A0A8H4PZX4_9HYPO|nr:hypothetical protein OCS_02599 [Ophiocordyceps sinensis CO18]KAF4513567.1 hypothetical protein G6O67_000822 [Ophiocordyceps sinensis]